MHSFDSLARTLVGPSPRHTRPARRAHSPLLPHLLSLGCALLPLAVMVQAYVMTV